MSRGGSPNKLMPGTTTTPGFRRSLLGVLAMAQAGMSMAGQIIGQPGGGHVRRRQGKHRKRLEDGRRPTAKVSSLEDRRHKRRLQRLARRARRLGEAA